MTTTLPTQDTALLDWADRYCPKGAAATRAAISQEEHDRCATKLDALWWAWGAKVWARWIPEGRVQHNARAEALEAQGMAVREAHRTAFIEMHDAPT
jgi:hypothetical protein